MDISRVGALWAHYCSALPRIDRTIHENDDMFRTALRGWDDYLIVGQSSVDVILHALVLAKVPDVHRVLDFGCGHGRVARHLRLLFPEASLFFTDIDETAWGFCARQFQGEGFSSFDDFEQLALPGNIDVIFLGSVFTHLDWSRSRTLWSKLFEALEPGGALIATFRGSQTYRMMMRDPGRFNAGGYYEQLLEDYRHTGFGYQDYKGFVNWGQNLFSVGKVAELAEGHDRARLIGYKEWGWANIHDVAVWSKT